MIFVHKFTLQSSQFHLGLSFVIGIQPQLTLVYDAVGHFVCCLHCVLIADLFVVRREPFDRHEVGLVKAAHGEDLGQERVNKVLVRRRALAAGRGDHDQRPAAEERPRRAVSVGVLEREPRLHDTVDVLLEHVRDAEVPDRACDDEEVRAQQLLCEQLDGLERFVVGRVLAAVTRAPHALHGVAVKLGQFVAPDIHLLDREHVFGRFLGHIRVRAVQIVVAVVVVREVVEHGRGHARRDRVGRDTGVDMHHGLLLVAAHGRWWFWRLE